MKYLKSKDQKNLDTKKLENKLQDMINSNNENKNL